MDWSRGRAGIQSQKGSGNTTFRSRKNSASSHSSALLLKKRIGK